MDCNIYKHCMTACSPLGVGAQGWFWVFFFVVVVVVLICNFKQGMAVSLVKRSTRFWAYESLLPWPFFFFFLNIGICKREEGREGHGNPLQYSCLEISMDREAWWAIVHSLQTVRHNGEANPNTLSKCQAKWEDRLLVSHRISHFIPMNVDSLLCFEALD